MRTFTASSLQKIGGSSKDFRSAALGSLCSIPRTAVCESPSRRNKKEGGHDGGNTKEKNQAKIW